MMAHLYNLSLTLQRWLNVTTAGNFLALLAMRLYLAPIFWMAGMNKWHHIDSTIAWFGNTQSGLGFPFPTQLAYMATFAELIGAVCLVLGLAVRWISIPLMIVMLVAAFGVHWEHGWDVIAEEGTAAATRLTQFLEWVKVEHPARFQSITELGRPVILNNGIEFAITYFIMLFTLFFYGAGRYVSLDYWYNQYLLRYKYATTTQDFTQGFQD